MQPTRLFDALAYQLQHFPKNDMLVFKQNKKWQKLSTTQVQEQANRLSAGLLQLGLGGKNLSVEKADKIAIIANNRPEWVIADLAVQQIGAILVPIYPTTNREELRFILKEAEVKCVFISSQSLYNKYHSVLKDVDTIKHIYTFDQTSAEHWSHLLQLAEDSLLDSVETCKASIPETHIATIIYTSGTTGTPKGVMLTHKNILSCAMLAKKSFPFPDNPELRALSFLPLNHIFEKCLTYVYLYSGISIYFAEGLETVGENIREIKPHIFTTVPRLLEKVFEKIMNAGFRLKGIKKRVFFWAVALAEKYDNRKTQGAAYRWQLKLANKLVFAKWRQALGGEVMYIVTGGAACSQKLLRLFNAAKIPVYEGYGPTENSPVVSVNRNVGNQNFIGTVGPVLEGLLLKIEADGEICVKGPTVMAGYYKRPQLTAETIIDGWLHTGDVGTLVGDRYLKITDRKKELFKTSGGKYVAPQPIENKLKESSMIEQVMIVGAEQKFVAALIVPAKDVLAAWAERHGLPIEKVAQLLEHAEVKKHYAGIIREVNMQLSNTEQIKKYVLLPNIWSAESGELSPKLSLRRKVVAAKYTAEIEKLFT